MTKEELIERHADSRYNVGMPFGHAALYNMLDEYAQLQSIAFAEGLTLSEKIDQLLVAYNNSPVWKSIPEGIPLPPEYVELKDVKILHADGHVSKI